MFLASACPTGMLHDVAEPRRRCYFAAVAETEGPARGIESSRFRSASALNKCEQIFIDGLGLGRRHAVWKTFVSLERAVLQQLCRQWCGVGVGNDLGRRRRASPVPAR
jgi:hypothetical protein